MHKQTAFSDRAQLTLPERLGVVAATLLAGLLACGALLAALAGPVPGALAAPATPASGPVNYPGGAGCTTTLQACINNSPAGSTILIQPNTYFTDGLTLNKAVSLTGASSATVILHALANQRVLTITGAAVDSSVVISGLTFAGGHAVGGGCPAGCGGALLITATAQPLLIQLTISNSLADSLGGGLYADTNSPLVMRGVAVLSNTSSSSGGGVFGAGNVTLNGGVFQSNQCTGLGCGGGALFANHSFLVATGTQFLDNTSKGNGAGARAFGDVTLSGGLFQNNHCTGGCFGGGLFGADFLVTNTLFISNTSTADGGGAHAAGNATLSGVTFQSNQCTPFSCRGGGLFDNGSLAATNSQFISNTSTSAGGGAFAGGNVLLNGGSFQKNQCTGAGCVGGGLRSALNLSVAGTQFLSNTSNGNGGGVSAFGDVALGGGLFQNNQCLGGCFGGGLFGADFLVTNTQFVSNTSTADGGGAHAAGNVSLNGVAFQKNQCSASCSGGGLYANGSLAATNSQFISNTSTGGAGGAFVGGNTIISAGLFGNNLCTLANCAGGGLFALNSLAVTDTLFLSNAAQQGGGLYQNNGTGRLVNDLFAANHAGLHGAALLLASPGGVSLLFTTIASPTVGGGSAIYVTTGTVGVTDTLIASYTVGLEIAGGSVREDDNLFSGLGATISGTVASGGHSHTGAAGFVNPAAGPSGYHIFIGSDAIDTGVDQGIAFDIDGDPRPLGHGFDIGYDEANIRRLFLALVRR